MDQDRLNKWQSQMRKGILDLVILSCLLKQEFYGYQLIKKIKEITEMNISEGTIYPLLNRLKKDGCITSRWVEIGSGLPRKYYRISPRGKEVVLKMKEGWEDWIKSINRILEEIG